MGQGQPRLWHPHRREAGRGLQLLLADDGRGPTGHGVGYKPVAVGQRPLEGDEDLAGGHLPGVIGHPGDHEIIVATEATALQTGQEAFQGCGGRLVTVHGTLAAQAGFQGKPEPLFSKS